MAARFGAVGGGGGNGRRTSNAAFFMPRKSRNIIADQSNSLKVKPKPAMVKVMSNESHQSDMTSFTFKPNNI